MLAGYACGVFPMARSADDPDLHWVDPHLRGILPLDGFHASHSLRRRMARCGWTIRIDTAFSDVVRACADRDETWINAPLLALYQALHRMGHAHSFEVWDGEALIGGVFGVTLGAAFFGESMFSRRTDASKVALACLVNHLNRAGFLLFDTQFLTPHLASLGAVEIPRADYQRRLQGALGRQADFGQPPSCSVCGTLQRITQTS